MNESADKSRRFVLMLTDFHHPAASVEEFREACWTFRDLLPKQQKQFARSIGVSGYDVWRARNVALVACRAFDLVESRGLALTKENFRMIRDEGKRAPSDTSPQDNSARDVSMGAIMVLMKVEPWSNRGCCRISGRRKVKLPWWLRLEMAMPWIGECQGRLRYIKSRLRRGAT